MGTNQSNTPSATCFTTPVRTTEQWAHLYMVDLEGMMEGLLLMIAIQHRSYSSMPMPRAAPISPTTTA